jgi:hypothetical protein
MRERGRRCRTHRVYVQPVHFGLDAGFATIFYDDVAVNGARIESFFERARPIVSGRTEERAIHVQFFQAPAVFQRFEIFGNEPLRGRMHWDEPDLVTLAQAFQSLAYPQARGNCLQPTSCILPQPVRPVVYSQRKVDYQSATADFDRLVNGLQLIRRRPQGGAG